MYNSQLPTDGSHAPKSVSMSAGGDAFDRPTERNGNERIRLLLKSFGLRTSLIRLKVIDALLSASLSERSLGVRGVHSHLLELDIPLSFLSVREVLKRLCSEGVITLNPDKSYSLHPQAVAILCCELATGASLKA
ncbi:MULTISPECIES: fe2+ zn2+ uptake regulation protein [unclassified Pseudomonas]|uniref:fe2+ zn2+ uptake regulation protein n=1 Tax=unclassified Pseudomonas TaxID=196821 RepID=UPI002AC8CC67|nr:MULTISPECIES: fe2+ zn2+ uptake regulation protein [unclassified Pseudomonas]MEB0046787.1 fe2+ zn2+ uptake regulation protein [Pseudomonas sp. Dout3]MEB0097605.1 fe2+ zn2+ uptake regulation protein [Pseudomonas sp. DC1.2]WPX61254.1 fe2+ zn2+ uptake regulation protein [Pseudomonas sp. DC1.2]